MGTYNNTTRKRLRLIRLLASIARTRHFGLLTDEEWHIMQDIVVKHLDEINAEDQATT